MSHHRCCCPTDPVYDCDNWPPCIEITFADIETLTGCSGISVTASGHNGTFKLARDGASFAYTAIAPMSYNASTGGSSSSSDSIEIHVSVGCGEAGFSVQNILAHPYDATDIGLRDQLFRFISPQQLFGETIDSDIVTSCGFKWLFGGGTAVVTIPDSCDPPPSPLMAPSGRFSSDAEIDAMGGSVETERAKAKNGGCCGTPSKD